MLSERQLEALLEVFRKRMQGVTEDYLIRMGEHLRDIGQLTASDVNRIVEMKRLNANLEQIKKEIAKAARMSVDDIEKLFKAVAESDLRFANEIYASDREPTVKANKAIERILKAQAKITKQELSNLSQTTLLSNGYREAIDVAVQTVQGGVSDYGAAIRRAMKLAAGEGLRVKYPNSGITRRLDTAVRQNVLDGVRAVNQDIMRQVGKEFNADGIELSAHNLCAEDHLPYQGTQMSIKDFERLQGRLDRPFGMWNCHHSWHYIILGVSKPAYTQEQLDEFKRTSREKITIDGVSKSRYEWTQEQRKIETAIRYQKDIAVAAKASGDMMTRRECQYNINNLWKRYDKVSEAAGLREKPERTRVEGFSAVKAVNQLKKNNKDGISIDIDELTPCLRKMTTGELVKTTVTPISPTRKAFARWEFDWTLPEKEGYTVYALRVKGERVVQGLVATKEVQGYIQLGWAESAPHNNPHNSLYFSGRKEYNGVGGHLFAEACRQSFESGHGGVIGFTAKTNLIEYYKDEFGADVVYGQSMIIQGQAALDLVNKYYGGAEDEGNI